MENKPLVSVITVCYNSEKYIKSTIESVLMQTYKNIEYIIIDGKSTDKTINIIREYNFKFNNKIKLISETDTGIYDAMNKGIDISCGDYLFFLNSGDFFLDNRVIIDLVKYINKNNIDLLYGNVKLDRVQEKYRSNKINSIYDLIFSTICHQSILASRKCFKDNIFDRSYKWLADYKWLINCVKDMNVKLEYINRNIAFFDPRNVTIYDSYTLKMERLKERLDIGCKAFSGIRKVIFLLNQLRLMLKYKYFYKYDNHNK